MFTPKQIENFKIEMEEYRKENCEEEPGDDFFYGVLTEKIESKEKLSEIMIKGVTKYMVCYDLEKDMINQGLDMLDRFFEHDGLRENYFDFLLPNDESHEFFNQVEEGVLKNL